MFRALSKVIDFGRLQTLQGDQLMSRTVATRGWSLIETETSSSSAAAAAWLLIVLEVEEENVRLSPLKPAVRRLLEFPRGRELGHK